MSRENRTRLPLLLVRLLFVTGMMGLTLCLFMLIPYPASSFSVEQDRLSGWQNILIETFDDGIGTGWTLIDASTSDGGEYFWGATDFIYTSPFTSAWSVGGGEDGADLVATRSYTYPENVDSWLIYGPLDLSRVWQADLYFDWWLDSAPGDWFGWCVTTSLDDLQESCQGARLSGRIGTWISGTLSLDAYAHTTQPVYVAFHFTSNDDGRVGTGAFVDNVIVQGDYGFLIFLPLTRWDPTPTPSSVDYRDDFNSSSSGWLTHQADCCRPAYNCDDNPQQPDVPILYPTYKYNLYYSGGQYHVYIPVSCLEGGIHGVTRHIYPVSLAPGVLRPTARTCIEMRGNFENTNTHASRYGLVFAANSDASTHYSVLIDDRADWSIYRTDGYDFPGPNHSFWNETRTVIVPWVGGPRWPAKPATQSNTVRAEVTNGQVKVYINGELVHTFSDAAITNLRYVGVIGGSWEWGDTRIGFDYFYVDEGCDTY